MAPPRENRDNSSPVGLIEEHFQGKTLSEKIGFATDTRPARFVEQAYFTLRLVKEGVSSIDPVFSGLFSRGRPSSAIPGWVDGDYSETAVFPDGFSVSLRDRGLDIKLFKILGELVPPGGSLMISYTLFSKQSKIHEDTKEGLDRGYPPAVTPLGFLIFLSGSGLSFKDWYFAEGGREGPEKIQGYKPIDPGSTKEKAKIMLPEIQGFLAASGIDDELALSCRLRAEKIIRILESLLK